MKIKIGQFVKITKRKVSSKIQPNVEVGVLYKVMGIDRTKSKADVLILNINNKPTRCNSDRFSWELVTSEQIAKDKFDAEVKATVDKINKSFTEEEFIKISIVPLIMYEIAWHYAFKTIEEGKKHRIQEVKGLSRAIKQLRQKYIWILEKDLNRNNIEQMERNATRFIEDSSVNFLQLFYTIKNEIYRQQKGREIKYIELRVFAYLTKKLIDIYKEAENDATKIIKERLGRAVPRVLPFTNELRDCVDANLNFDIEETYQIKTGLNIYKNQLKKMKVEL